ncbi:hypothetical protein BGX28_005538 [Mortierella sp. GBA30]|nr:hypothetical protein BGX28_005538 [Mortierella sp. GBA30]
MSSFALWQFSMTWSVVISVVILACWLPFLSPATSGGRSHGALSPGFCPDCGTIANLLIPCAGTFTPADVEVNGELQLLQQQRYSGCICKEVIIGLISNCVQCERLNGYNPVAPSSQVLLTTCIKWGMNSDDWKAPYTGPVVPGTEANLGNGPNPPAPSNPATTTTASKPITTTISTPKSTGGTTTIVNGGSKPSLSSGPNMPGSSSSPDNITNPAGDKAGSSSSLSKTTIGIVIGIVGLVIVAGVVAIVVKKNQRRPTPKQTNDISLRRLQHHDAQGGYQQMSPN